MSFAKTISKQTWVWIFISLISYLFFGYDLDRKEFGKLLCLFILLAVSFLRIVSLNKNNFKLLTFLVIGFRLVLLFATPNLSDDFYRFIWDGRMIWEGINPYLYLPETNPNIVAEGAELYQGMGSMNGSHYTCYPPINQLTFFIPAIFFSKNLFGSTVVMRLLIVLADLGTLYVGKKLLEHMKLPVYKIFYYVLNPFIILELTGNLHFEGVMIFFLATAIYFLFTKRTFYAALFFAISVSVKLIPILFLPVLLKFLGLKKSIQFYAIVIVGNIIFFIPFMSNELYYNFMDSIHLYFQNFEFNASVYYLVREIGFWIKGYNIIHVVGKVTPIIVLCAVLLLAFVRNNSNKKTMISTMLFAICVYYSLASIVHPWYIAIPLFLSVFTQYKFPLVWSLFAILSYAAYQQEVYHENLYLVTIEYIIVYGVLLFELFYQKKRDISF